MEQEYSVTISEIETDGCRLRFRAEAEVSEGKAQGFKKCHSQGVGSISIDLKKNIYPLAFSQTVCMPPVIARKMSTSWLRNLET